MNKDLEQVKDNSNNISLEVEFANSLTFAIREHLFHFKELTKKAEEDREMSKYLLVYEFVESIKTLKIYSYNMVLKWIRLLNTLKKLNN